MSFFKKQFPTLLILSYFFLSPVHFFSAEEKKESNSKTCETRPADYFLSQALRNQTRAKQQVYYQDNKKAFAYFQDSVVNFEKYISCVPSEKVNSLTHLNLSLSYLELGEYDKSAEQVNLALAKDKNNRDAIILQTKLMIRQGKLKEAESFLSGQISTYPDDSDFLFLLGSLNKELNQWNKSILYFTSLYDSIQNREGQPKYKIHALKNLADLHYQKSEAKKALFYYQAYLILNPRDTGARFQVAQIFNVMGDFGASKKILEEIYKSNPKDKNVELLLAEMYFVESRMTSYPYFKKLADQEKIPAIHLTNALFSVLKRDWIFADGFLREFIPKHEKRLAARLAWIEVLRARYSIEDLVAELKTVSEITYSMQQYQLSYNLAMERKQILEDMESKPEELAYNYWFLSNCMEKLGSPNRAILYSKKAIAISPESQEKQRYQLHLGHILLSDKIRRNNEALKISQSVISTNPGNSSAHYLEGYSFFQTKQYSKALSSLNKAIELEPKNSGYYFFRGLIYEKLNDFPGLESNLRNSMELTPNNPVTYNYLGYYLADKGIRKEEARELIQKAVDLEPDNGAYQDSLGWIYFRLGDTKNAIFHLYLAKQMLSDRDIKDPTVYDHLGEVYFHKEEYAIARDYWKRAIAMTEDEKEKQMYLNKINRKIPSKEK
ncbi:MAG: tetratricopeptide repeat protein [Leptospira sp.]|nr:tetratricopeptide repeat protein [Leptospira sp.]